MNEIILYCQWEDSEIRLARLLMELERQGARYSVRQDICRSVGGVDSAEAYVVTIRGAV